VTTVAAAVGRAVDLWYLLARVRNVGEIVRSRGTAREVVWRLRSGGTFRAQSGSSDILAVREILLDHVYPIHDDTFGLVVDIGAHVGVFTACVAPRAERVVAFEPTARNFGFLRDDCRSPRGNIVAHRLAVTGDGRHVRINLHPENTGQHSIFEHSVSAAGVEEVASVPSADLLGFCGADGIDLLKVDAEGAEHEILAAAGPVLARTNRLIVEANTVDAGRTPRHVETLLRDAGFRVDRLSGDDEQSVLHARRLPVRR
jgi:FkbM family methyltransferase